SLTLDVCSSASSLVRERGVVCQADPGRQLNLLEDLGTRNSENRKVAGKLPSAQCEVKTSADCSAPSSRGRFSLIKGGAKTLYNDRQGQGKNLASERSVHGVCERLAAAPLFGPALGQAAVVRSESAPGLSGFPPSPPAAASPLPVRMATEELCPGNTVCCCKSALLSIVIRRIRALFRELIGLAFSRCSLAFSRP
ncbi:hypothetical protein P4O66_020803, partial [Electrophorus voltai]